MVPYLPRIVRFDYERRRGISRKWWMIVIFAGIACKIWMVPDHQTLRGVACVVDGDTLKIDAHVIRLEGVDAPELAQPCTENSPVEWCGVDAKHQLQGLIGDQVVVCVSQTRDAYRRFVAKCRVGEGDLGKAMVEGGYAFAHTHQYHTQEVSAKQQNLGIWRYQMERPWEWRKSQGQEIQRSGASTSLGVLEQPER